MIRVNLAPPEQRRRRLGGFAFRLPPLNLGIVVAGVFALAIVVIAVSWIALWRQESRLAAEIARDRRELATLKVQLADITKVREQAADMQKRLQTIQDLTKNQGRPLRVMDAFLDAVPPDLWITGLEERGALLKIVGTAFSTTAVADLMANLRQSGKFSDVDILVAKQDIAKSPSPVTFEVTCRFGT